MLTGRRIVFIISGGIAAYKSLELIRMLGRAGASVRCILTRGGAQFVTPLSVAALSGNKVYDDLFAMDDNQKIDHIRLSREADLILVAPATADIMARIAEGRADDLATAVVLASDKPVMLAPAMNPVMWANEATQAHISTLKGRGFMLCGPASGDTACGEPGSGRMVEPQDILTAINAYFGAHKPLFGKRAIVTSGPTYEPIDPVRFIGNKSSGKQGHAIASALANAGAAVTLVSGPVAESDPHGVHTVHIESAREMLDAVMAAMPADIAVCAAAVADWRVAEAAPQKMKKRADGAPPTLSLVENPDILKTIAHMDASKRPAYVVGFAAETADMLDNAQTKRAAKGCDLLLANDVSGGAIFGAADTHLHALSDDGTDDWGAMDKQAAAAKLVQTLIEKMP